MANQIEEYFVSLLKPKRFEGDSNSIIIEHKRAYEKLCASMSSRGLNDISNVSVMRFYSLIDVLSKPQANGKVPGSSKMPKSSRRNNRP